MPDDDPERRAVAVDIVAAGGERARAARATKRLRWALAASIVAIVAGLTVAIVVVRAEHREAKASAALAAARLDDIRRLADVKLLADVAVEADALWPALPDKVPAMDAWLARARTLVERLPGHRAYLAELKGGPKAEVVSRLRHLTHVGTLTLLVTVNDLESSHAVVLADAVGRPKTPRV